MKAALFGFVAAIAGVIALAMSKDAKADEGEAGASPGKRPAGTPTNGGIVPPGVTPGASRRPEPSSPEAPATPAEANLPSRPVPLPGRPPPPLSKAKTVEERVATALASQNPLIMRAMADELEAEGAHFAAKGLREAASFLEAGANPIPNPGSPERVAPPLPIATRSPGIVPAVPRPAPTPTPAPPPEALPPGAVEIPEMVITATPEDPVRAKALELTNYLTSIGGLAGRYKENRAIVSQYQTAEGLAADGKYGPGSATRVLKHGIVPVVPYYWSPKGATYVSQQKMAFITEVKKAKAQDPSRAAQYDRLIADTQRS